MVGGHVQEDFLDLLRRGSAGAFAAVLLSRVGLDVFFEPAGSVWIDCSLELFMSGVLA